MQELLSIISPQLKYTGLTINVASSTAPSGTGDEPLLTLPTGIIAILGPNGSGKSALANIIENGWHFMTNHLTSPTGRCPRVRTLAFSNLHALTGFSVEYYQQRFESMMNDDVPTVSALIGEAAGSPRWQALSSRLGLDKCMDKKTNYLSSGELRKLLIANAMMDLPDILVLDNPYIGLDATARRVVESAITDIADQGTSLIMLVCDPNDVHPHATRVLSMDKMTVRDGGNTPIQSFNYDYDHEALAQLLSLMPVVGSDYSGFPVVEMRHCTVRYGRRVLVEDIDWTVRAGECWALSGPNGSGKSTLLSLINADNPQAYSNDIRLFGIRRGSGESIWDIKKRIGFLSSESHLYFRGYNDSVYRILSRAVKDDPADFGPLDKRQQSIVELWMRTLGIVDWGERLFRQLSFGQQRLVLLAAALVKMPSLLILDEPLHGLDVGVKRAVIDIVDRLASTGMTLIYVTHNPAELPTCITHTKNLRSHGTQSHLLSSRQDG